MLILATPPASLASRSPSFSLVVVAGGGLDLAADLLDPPLDLGALAGPFDDRGVVLVDDHLLGPAQFAQGDVLELAAEALEDRLAAGEEGDVFEHRLAAVAVAGGLDGAAPEGAAELVDHQRGQGLAVDVFGHQDQRLAGVDHGLQERHQLLDVRDLLLVDQDVGVFEHRFHLLRVGDEIGREVAAVELHSLDPLDLGRQALAFVNGDHAVLAHLFHGVGQHVADLRVVVGGHGAHLGDLLLLVLDGDRHLLELLGHVGDGPLHALLEVQRIDAGHHGPKALVEDRLGEDRGGGGAVAGHVAGLRGDLADHPAPMFSYTSSRSISLATVTPSLVTVGEPKLFWRITFRPRGPRVTFTAWASLVTPRRRASRAS